MENVIRVINKLELERKEINISRESIEFISTICKSIKPKNILEIGTFNGYSVLWLSLFAKKVITLEIDQFTARTAEENLKKADCKNVEIIIGDALETLKNLKEKFDVVLIDGKKSEYKNYLELILNLLNKNSLIFADNTISHKLNLSEFFDYLKNSNLYFKELNLGKGLMIISKNKF